MSPKVHILITMDVEPVKLEENWTGPDNPEISERYIRSYWELSREYGYTPGFFIHPESARLHGKLFNTYKTEGASLGLHVHSTKFHYPDNTYEFGYYDASAQEEIVSAASWEWEQAIGFKPVYFRPGAFSANDATAPVLAKLGFRGGSLSIPGRIWPERYCVWAGALPYPHRTHRAFRCAPGEMDFIDIPLSVDFSGPVSRGGYFCYQDLRPSARRTSAEDTLLHIIEQIKNDKPEVPVIQVITHNDQPFNDPDHESRRRLETVLRSIGPLCERCGLEAVDSSIEKVCSHVMSLPLENDLLWNKNNNVDM
jgi:hypothetical protein